MAPRHPKTFMLLPDCMHKPEKGLHLGTLLLRSEDTKLPNPDLPLNAKTRQPIPVDDILTQEDEPWLYTNGQTFSGHASINAELPVFAPVGGGLLLGRSKTDNLTIRCSKVDTTRFAPTKQYLAQVLAAETDVLEYCRQNWFPSVYMVTGLKIAVDASIEDSSERSHEGAIDPAVDISATGVPLNLGLSFGKENADNRKLENTIKGPFILAYQLRRLKMKSDASLRKDELYDKHALFDDSRLRHEDASKVFDQTWVMDEVSSETEHNV